MATAKVVLNGGIQYIRLPNEFWVTCDEVCLKKTPEGFLVIDKDPWALFRAGIGELSNDFMSSGREHPLQTRKTSQRSSRSKLRNP